MNFPAPLISQCCYIYDAGDENEETDDEEDDADEDEVLRKRRGTLVMRSARPDLAVPASSTRRLWLGVPNSRPWPRDMRLRLEGKRMQTGRSGDRAWCATHQPQTPSKLDFEMAWWFFA